MSDNFTTHGVDFEDSWKVGSLRATYQELKEVFGMPNMGPSGDEKVQGGWKIMFFNGSTYAEISDWKENKSLFDVTEWNIAGHTTAAVELVKAEIDTLREKNGELS